MKFYGVGAVWGGEDNKILCRFIDGELETDDEKVIKKLLDNGYKHDGKQEKVVEEVVAESATNEEISAVETPVVVDGEKVAEAVVKQAEKKPVATSAKTAQVKKVVKK